jgi:hypothetical protein
VCKWAAGIADNLALSILFECMGIEVPIVVASNFNPALARTPPSSTASSSSAHGVSGYFTTAQRRRRPG